MQKLLPLPEHKEKDTAQRRRRYPTQLPYAAALLLLLQLQPARHRLDELLERLDGGLHIG